MILVVGVARSGTSAVARVLEQRFGVDMGGPSLVRPENPDGVYERRPMENFDKRLVAGEIGVVEWAKTVRREFGGLTEPWGYKHPMGAPIIPLYLALYPDATVIWVQRDLMAAARSWQRVFRMGEKAARVVVESTWAQIRQALAHCDHLAIDMAEQKTDDEIVEILSGYRGLEA